MLPPDLRRLAQLHRARQQTLAGSAVLQVRRRWGLLDSPAAWQRIAGLVLRIVTAHQAEAARGVSDYVATALRLGGAESDPAGRVVTSRLVGVASDGRDLAGLLGYPAFEAGALADQGMGLAQALLVGQRHLERIVQTQIQDVARVATGLAQVNDRRVTGYVRVVTPPACSRCVILAGRWYRASRGFQRHPQCDCVMMPSAEVIEPQSPRALFDAMTPEQLRKAGWAQADIQAIHDGADLSQVTNARRDLRSTVVAGRGVQTTGVNARGRIRLTPESIYAEAERLGWSRDETIRQLQRFGYII